LGLLPAALAFSYSPVMGWLAQQAAWLDGIAQALMQPLRLLPLTGLVTGFAAGLVLLAYRTFAANMMLGWNQLHSVPLAAQLDDAETAVVPPSPLPNPVWRYFPAPLRCFMLKEWRSFRRSPQRLTGLFTAFLPIVIVLLPLLLSARRSDPQWRPFFFWLLLVVALTFAYVTILNETLPALPREGRRLALLKMAPLATAVWLRHKFWGLPWPLTLLIWMGVLLALGLFWRLAAWQVGALAVTLGWTLLLAAALFYGLGALLGSLEGEDDDAKMSGTAVLLALGGYVLLALLTLATTIWLLARWQPESAVVEMIRPLATGVLGRLFAPSPVMGWALLAGQGTAVALILGVWRLARLRLVQWE
jgi:hypothetical protein